MKHLRWVALGIAAAAALIAGIWSAVDYRLRPRLVTGPMVQMVTTDGFTLVWQMHPPQPANVEIAHTDGTPVGTFPAQSEGDGNERYVAVVEGLAPGARYVYQITCQAPSGHQRALARHTVRTAPQPGGSFRFLAFGDSGAATRAACRLARRMPDYEPDLIIHTGDIVSPDGNPEDFPAKLYRPYAHLIAQAPLYPCLGNHEFRTHRAQPVLDAFVLPPNGPAECQPERHYWFDFGSVRFVAIDSNHDYPLFRDVVAPWLDEVLTAAGDRWKVVFFHEPIFTNGKYEPAEKLLKSVVPILDRHRVELVLSGHNHMYERTHPIRNGRVAPDGDGTVYVTTGAGGNNLYEARLPPPSFMAAWCDEQHSFTVVDVTPDVLALRQIGIDGSVLDEHRIMRMPAAAPAVKATGPVTRSAISQ